MRRLIRHRVSPRETMAVLISGTTIVASADAIRFEGRSPAPGVVAEASWFGVGWPGPTEGGEDGCADATTGETLNPASARDLTLPDTGSTSSRRIRYSPG